MKKLIYFTLLFMGLQLHGQSYWSVVYDHTNKSYPTTSTLFNDSLIIVGGFGNVFACYGHVLLAYNSSGEMVWSHGTESDALYSDSSFIYAVGYNYGADDVLGDQYLNFTVLEASGNIISSYTYPEDIYAYENEVTFYPQRLSVLNSEKFLVSSDSEILKADTSGKVYWIKSPEIEGTILNAEFINEEKFCISTSGNIYLTDSSGIVTLTVDPGYDLSQTILKNDTLYCLAQDRVILYDTALNEISSIELDNVLDDVNDIRIKDSLIWISGINNNLFTFIKRNKFTDNEKLYTTLNFGSYYSFEIMQNYIIPVSRTPMWQINVNGINMNDFPPDYIFPDVSIVDLKLSSEDFSYHYNMNDELVYDEFHFNADVSIKNNSSVTVNSVSLYSLLNGGFNCIRNIYYEKFDDLNLQPGEYDTLRIEDVYQDFGLTSNNICFEILAPNSSFELLFEDNDYCTSIITGIRKTGINEKLQIFPNPVQDELHIKLENEIYDITIFDMLGKPVFTETNNSNENMFDISFLKRGIYTIVITTSFESGSYKIIKL